MKYRLTFKTPDIQDQVLLDSLEEDEHEKLRALLDKYVSFGEYVNIELDTEAQTAKVVSRK